MESVPHGIWISGENAPGIATAESAGHLDWLATYPWTAALVDGACALASAVAAAQLRFPGQGLPLVYLALTCGLPVLWWVSVSLAGGYERRVVGLGSDEFRRILNAAVGLTAAIAIVSYWAKLDLARGYFAVALPLTTALDMVSRYALRQRLHRARRDGQCSRRVVAVGHPPAVGNLVTTLRRDRHHGLVVVAACVTDPAGSDEVGGTPVAGGLAEVTAAVRRYDADTVAVLACPEMDGVRLRELAWELERTGTDLCVAPALLDVAGPRTSIRPVAGLPLLHVDHPELVGAKQAVKAMFDRTAAALALIMLAPLFAVLAVSIRLDSAGPVLFRQVRVGKSGRLFTLCKFRTMVADAEARKAFLADSNEADGVLFKIRRDPRVTRLGAWLRRCSLDEFPQLLNVLRGDMSLVGPRPAVPDEAVRHGSHMRRRLAVKPGITGLWQVSGRSDLPWDEAERLDIRYVENWSFAFDLQILWKTVSAVIRGTGAY
jgi:exopolysaccharide biosynthesis polyprenyl glycosylphosphotransferase